MNNFFFKNNLFNFNRTRPALLTPSLCIRPFTAAATTIMDASTKLSQLRVQMAKHNLAAYFIPSEDAHQSEYIADHDARRAFISNFTGSAGFAIVTLQKAALWTDGRYFLQANQQLDTSSWTLMKAGLPETPTKEAWLASELKQGDRLGVDPALISFEAAKKLREQLEKSGQSLVAVEENLIDAVWAAQQPPQPANAIEHLPIEFSGRSSASKIEEIRVQLQKSENSALIVTALDEIAWLFNLRGADISFNPVFISYALIPGKHINSAPILFLRNSGAKLSISARQALEADGISVADYGSVFDSCAQFVSSLPSGSGKVLITPTCNWKLAEAIGAANFVCKASPVEAAKAIKNEVEIAGFRQCHIRDGAALVRYFAWLEAQLKANPKAVLDEVDGADRLEQFRAEGANFRGLSFDTISGSGPNGAIIHYKPEKPSAARITAECVYLCDSGAQYLDGTTDVTRTVHFGLPTAWERECYTRVLKGNLFLKAAIFPAGTSGMQLDALARASLWQVGLDFRHGTGHGVGHFLNVHEGPQSISFRPSSNEAKLVAGMTVTDEPGYYEDGKFGIRIEDVLLVKEVKTPNNFGGVKFFGFENLTMCPYAKSLIDKDLLSGQEIDLINAYHAEVLQKLLPLLESDALATAWLKRECSAL